MSNIIAIIQVRMGSTRLPGKSLAEIEGKPMLWHVVERTKQAKKVDKVVIATTVLSEDDAIANLAKEMDVDCFRGDVNDVLDRYYQTAKKFSADVIVRVTGDCPVVDPKLIDKTIGVFLEGGYDHVSTSYPKATFPDGLDVAVFNFSSLEKAWKEAKLISEREHVTPYIWKNPALFKLASVEHETDLSHLRWTVDEQKDLTFIREIYKKLYKPGKIFFMEDVLTLLKAEPNLAMINQNINRDEGYAKSLKEDSSNEKTN